MVFVTNDHILLSLWNRKRKLKRKIWRIFNLKENTLEIQDENSDSEAIWKIISEEDNNLEIACTDFSNLDVPEKRLVVLRNRTDQREAIHVVKFTKYGQIKHVVQINPQSFVLKEKQFPQRKFRIDNSAILLKSE